MKQRLAWFMIVWACLGGSGHAATEASGPVNTEVVQRDGRYLLLRGGEPYEVKGAGLEAADMASLATRGGNSIRTWSTRNAQQVLDQAHALGLTVALGLEVGRERHGFDYGDAAAVEAQLERLRDEVLHYRDHPALLTWIIGNELNLEASDPRVYDAVNDISEMIHELDPHHPTTSTLAGFGGDLAKLVNERAPDLDFVSIQLYGDLINLPRQLAEAQFARPWMVTEWGTIGHWEVPKTPWGAPIELNSSEKARTYQRMYDSVIARPSPFNLGAYVFLWGQKQERTPTWYGLFLPGGESTEAVDVMQRIWTGEWPANRAPLIEGLQLDGRTALDAVELAAGRQYPSAAGATDPDGDPLRYHWEVRHESRSVATGGDAEEMPPLVPGAVAAAAGAGEAVVTAPQQPGAYRLFVYVYDGHGHGAHANIPFLVR